MPDSRAIPRRRKRARRYRFQPPRHVPACMALARWITPLYLRRVLKVTKVAIGEQDIARLEALRDERVVLAPNHPTHDPAAMFQLGTALGERFYWLAAREMFERPLKAVGDVDCSELHDVSSR